MCNYVMNLLIAIAITSSYFQMSLPLHADDNTIHLTTLHWPPYNSPELLGGGFNTIVAKKIFEKAGLSLKEETYPWKRAILLAKTAEFDGYFPEYFSSGISIDFIFSKPIGDSPLGFAMRKDQPISWNTLADLKDYRIGTVSGYINTPQFDEMVANQELKVESAYNDTSNLRKLVKKRLDLVVIDRYVFEYLMSHDEFLKNHQSTLVFGKKLLQNKKLYVCFKKGRHAQQLVDRFNAAIPKVDIEKITADYMKSLR